MGIEPTSEAWEASVLSWCDARSILYAYKSPCAICDGLGRFASASI